MAELAPVLEQFFTDVLVMAEDAEIRNNRIALLQSLGRDFLALADLSKLHVEGGEA
jgi:glycyl-tRNA synthetase beta chain